MGGEGLNSSEVLVSWSKYPDTLPSKSGYYFTYYYSKDQDQHLYKAIYYDHHKNKWCSWRQGMSDPIVKGFVEQSGKDYYTECLRYAGEQVIEPFDDVW